MNNAYTIYSYIEVDHRDVRIALRTHSGRGLDSPYRSKRLAALLNFHMQVSDRVYVNSNTVPSLAQTEYARLFNCRDDTAIEVKYGFDRKNKGQLSAFGNWYRLTERLQSVTEQRTTYLTFSHSSLASVTVSYHGEFSKESLLDY